MFRKLVRKTLGIFYGWNDNKNDKIAIHSIIECCDSPINSKELETLVGETEWKKSN